MWPPHGSNSRTPCCTCHSLPYRLSVMVGEPRVRERNSYYLCHHLFANKRMFPQGANICIGSLAEFEEHFGSGNISNALLPGLCKFNVFLFVQGIE